MLPMLADLTTALDPARFFQRAMGHTPDAWQARLLRSTAPRILLNCCRQSGKSTATAALSLHTALYAAPALTLLVSPTERQSKELLRTVQAGYRALGRPVAAVVESTLTLELVNGSRILALPENPAGLRGLANAALLVVDEAAQVMDATYEAVLPMLGISHGRLLALSTPFGKRGWWHDAWTNGGPAWARFEVPITTAEIAARTDPGVLTEARRRGAAFYNQEYLCQFSDTQYQLFTYESVMAALSDDVRPLYEDKQAWEYLLSD